MSTGERFARHRCTSADGASFEFCRHGGHLLSFVPAGGRESLFLSDRAVFAAGAAIRGGVPVIFPQFASRGRLTKHGFARVAEFAIQATGIRDDGAAIAELVLRDDAASRDSFPHSFEVGLTFVARGDSLTITLAVTNTGDDAFSFTTALHGYFAVDELRSVRIDGLEPLDFEDHASVRATEPTLRFGPEVDRVYLRAPALLLIDGSRAVDLTCEGFREWVVWNPGEAKAGELADLGADDGERFVCVEPAVARVPVTLAPGATWRGTQGIRVRDELAQS